jgi:hypothetical protein
VHERLRWHLQRWWTRIRVFVVHLRHRLHRLRPSSVAAFSTRHGTAAASTCAPTAATATSAPPAATANAALAALATRTPASTASTAAQTGSAWLGSRGNPRSPAVPSPPGLCAGPPAGRPPDGVRTAQLLGTGASGLRRHAQACSSKARTGSPSGALAASVLLFE